MYEAARVTDPVCHTSALAGFLVGAVIGIALIATVAFATFTCGFGVALLAGLAAGLGASAILSLGESIGKMFTTRTGAVMSGSANVYVNGKHAAFATASTVACDKHSPTPLVAEGSSNVFINGKPAARKKDAITCGAKIDEGSSNTFIGGGTVQYLHVDDEVPPWLRTTVDWAFALAGLVGGLAGLAKAAGGISRAMLPCAAKFIGGFIIGEAVGRYVAGPIVHRAIGGLFGHPVDVTTGRKILLAQEDEVDFVVPSPLPLECGRFYASNLIHVGALGRGWVLPWEVTLRARDGHLWYTDAQGRESGFPMVTAGQTAFSVTEQRYLTCTRDGRYIVYDLNQRYYDFGIVDLMAGHVAHLLRVEDQAGQWQRFDRDTDGRLHTIVTSGGACVALDYDATGMRLASMASVHGDARNVLVTYGYDQGGQLASVTDANGAVVRRFTYADGLMTSHANALGFTCEYTWAGVAGVPRVVEMRNSAGEQWTFEFDIEQRESLVRGADGSTARWCYDSQFQIIECTDLDGAHYAVEYNDAGQPIRFHLPGEREVVLEYDEAGRIIAETDPLGRTTLTRYHGNSMRVSERELPDGGVWRADYDLQGRLLSTRDPLGRVERYEYPEGLTAMPVAYIDPQGGRKALEWSQRGQLLAYTDCSGKTTRYEYDADGLQVAVVNPLGERVQYMRRRTGEPLSTRLPDGSEERYGYDAAGLLVELVSADGRTRRWVRDARGLVQEALDPAGRRLRYRYSAAGKLTELSGDTGARYTFAYDSVGRMVAETRPDGVRRQFRHDATGQVIAIEMEGSADAGVEPPRRSVRFERDKMGQVLAQYTQTETTHYTRDLGDRLICIERTPTELGQSLGIAADMVRFEYDKVGRLLAEHGAHGSIGYVLDALDNPIQVCLPHGDSIDVLRYGSGHVHGLRLGEEFVSDFERDDLHREITRTQGRLTHQTGYDLLGRKLWQSSGLGADAIGPAQGRLWRSYRYNAAGELAEQRDSLRGSTRYQYDAVGQMLTQARVSEGSQAQFAWDAAGNLLDDIQRKSRGHVEGNRLRMWQDMRFEYDAWGNLKTKRKGAYQTQQFTYDAQDRLITARTEGPRGRVEARFEYDCLGRRTAKTETYAEVTGLKRRHTETRRFVWQGLRLAQEIRDSGVSSYVYSPDAPYTPLARIDKSIDETSTALAASTIETARNGARAYHFHTDLAGAPLEVTDDAGDLAWAGRYSAWGKVEYGEEQLAMARIEQPLRYAGQYADDSTGLHYNTFRYYDPDVGRFIHQDPIGLAGGENLYTYAPNPTMWVDPLGWVAETAPGYNVYGLYEPGATNPYYVGITDDLARRRVEHMTSGRLDATSEMRPLNRNVTYGQARGYEQAYIEHYGTKTGTIGEPISAANRGNKINSFDHASQTRAPSRQAYFENHYEAKTKQLKGGC